MNIKRIICYIILSEILDLINSRYVKLNELDKYSKNKKEEDYEILQSIIDFDPTHEKYLYHHHEGDLDRYSDILTCKLDNEINYL